MTVTAVLTALPNPFMGVNLPVRKPTRKPKGK
jgi:hypothetical protein